MAQITTDEKEIEASAVIIATGAVARRLPFPGSDEENGFWNKVGSSWSSSQH